MNGQNSLRNIHMTPEITVIIPNYNGQDTLAQCLGSVLNSRDVRFELIVVDDGSSDDSLEIIKQFPCRLIKQKHKGASAARNAGARVSLGKKLFFTDADCVLAKDTLFRAQTSTETHGSKVIIGGSYDVNSFDNGFYSNFQAAFINYSETKKTHAPDYIATHAMVIDRETFMVSGGFKEHWLPILEDVEYSHRLKRNGYSLVINPDLLVKHIFNYSLSGSVRNAIRKASYWSLYSTTNKDLLNDSGTASHELKINVFLFHVMAIFLFIAALTQTQFYITVAVLAIALNLLCNRNLLRHFYHKRDCLFYTRATLYYLFVYPVPVSIGGLIGVSKYLLLSKTWQIS